MIRKLLLPISLFAVAALGGCTHPSQTPDNGGGGVTVHATVDAAAAEFTNQKTCDPWVLSSPMTAADVPLYSANGKKGATIASDGSVSEMDAGNYQGGALAVAKTKGTRTGSGNVTLDMRTGIVTGLGPLPQPTIDWPSIWKTSDIEIDNDAQAQQVTHANMFYLLSSTEKNGQDSVPPMGLSSSLYGGHIFWDAEMWMMPALIVQHPDYAKSFINYRFRLLGQAEKNATAHGYAGAEYPWESADTGKEEAPSEFAAERHITGDVAYAAWQYYLWTGDKDYLKTEGWPILRQTALYWASRLKLGADGKYHITGVIPPDETAGQVDDDVYTNAVAQYNLRAATYAAVALDQMPDPQWLMIAAQVYLPTDPTNGIFKENAGTLTPSYLAKQADAQLLIYPLNVDMSGEVAGRTLDYWIAHTIKVGPAMTSSINAIIAARLSRSQQSLDLFRDAYQPFERTGLCAFSEKRTTDRVYFHTGMGGCLQTVFYGFAGLNVAGPGDSGLGLKVAESGDTELFANPKLPPGWMGLTIHGIAFRGKLYTMKVALGNVVTVTAGS